MPQVIDYVEVLRRLTSDGLVSLYHNSGAFGFPRETETHVVGWIGPEDPTIHSGAFQLVHLPPPHAENLAALLIRAWRELLASAEAWVMPMSHWAFELDFASHAWLPEVLREIGLDPAVLAPLNNGAAIAFRDDARDHRALQRLAAALLEHLATSDFSIVFPGQPVICTLHHHRQLWWVTRDQPLAKALAELARSSSE